MNLLSQAIKYVNLLKWSVIPINRRLKTPALESWKEYQQRFPTTQELQTWFLNSNHLNLAIVTGCLSKLVVVDVDSLIIPSELQELNLVSSISVKTGRGKHFYFRSNERIQNQVGVIPNVDIRGEGGYVIAPPSYHESGKFYSWMVEPKTYMQVPLLPRTFEFFSNVQHETRINDKGWISEALKGLTNGNRNDTFTKIVGNLHDGRRTMDDIFTILRPYCVLSNFSEGELLNVIKSVTRYTREESEELRSRESETIYSFDKSWDLYCQRKERQSSFKGPELQTGFAKIDNLLFGLRRGEILTIGARTGIGKTTLCLNITANLLQTGKRCLYLSTEMSFDTIWDRLFGIMGIKYEEFKQSFRGLSFFVSDIGNPSKERIRQMIQEVKPDVLILDHIQHLGDALSNRAQELGLYIKKLKDFAREFDIAIIVASQLNRGADSTNFKTGEPVKPQIYNLKECGGIEEESAVVILLNKEYVIDDTHDMYRLNVAKNRYGGTGLIELSFDKSNTRMVEI